MYVTCRADELIRFWGHEVKGQRPQCTLCMQKQLVNAFLLELTDGLLFNSGHLAEPMNWVDFRVMNEVKDQRVIYVYEKLLVITIFWEPVNGLQLNLKSENFFCFGCKIALWRRHHFWLRAVKFHLVSTCFFFWRMITQCQCILYTSL